MAWALAAVPERVTSCSKVLITNALRAGIAGLSPKVADTGLSSKTRSL